MLPSGAGISADTDRTGSRWQDGSSKTERGATRLSPDTFGSDEQLDDRQRVAEIVTETV